MYPFSSKVLTESLFFAYLLAKALSASDRCEGLKKPIGAFSIIYINPLQFD